MSARGREPASRQTVDVVLRSDRPKRPMQLGEAMSEDLAMRLTRSSRGRSVTARPTEHTPFNRDFSVSYDAESFSYVVDITPAGLFEEAFRFLERWIARHAAQRDGVYE